MSVFALLERLAPQIEREVNLVINSKQEAESLSSKLNKIQAGLQEAERKGVTDRSVKDWLKQLEDVAYEMDDVLDEFESVNLQVEVQDTSLSLTWDKVQSLLLSVCLCFKQVVSRREITQKMKALSERIDTIFINKGKYDFVPSENDRTPEFQQEESTSLVNKIKIYGLDHVKDRFVEKLVLEGGESDDNTQIISIVGVGGVGKSTLARLAYNDPGVDGLFAPKGWASLSQCLKASDIAKAILESLGGKSDDAHNLETLVQRIKKVVNNKKFLLVLDNVWIEDRNKWEMIRNCLDGGRGSRIVITTRLESVARMIGQWQTLGLLSDSICGNIVNGIALEGREMSEECEILRDIGMEIAKKCNGLPLAARSVGSMLALKFTEQEWRAVLESPLWRNEEEESDLYRLWNLSYLDLSPVLKRCFLSCVFFQKGDEINIKQMIMVWMAYGYLNSNSSRGEVQLKGFQYLNNLAMRSFFQRVAYDYSDDTYQMHDIMHDFATYLSGSDEYIFIDGELEKDKSSSSYPHWNSLGKLRTFCVCREELRLDIFSHLTSVRVLSLWDCNLQAVPEEVGKLIHLRYLDVSYNPITELPKTITDLCNLQTLDIESCEELSSLPEGIEKLINLRHLVNTDTLKLATFPQGLEKLTSLWTLSEFRGSNLGCLRNLDQLEGSLLISLENLNEKEASNANLCNKQHIDDLELHFGLAEEVDQVVEALKPPPNLQALDVNTHSGKWLSHWFHTSTFDNLKKVYFNGYTTCSIVPPFSKLPSLEKLAIIACGFNHLSIEFLESSSRHRIGGFPRLKKLRFKECNKWEKWEDIKELESILVPIMPLLKELSIIRCPALNALPCILLGKVTSLRVVKVVGNNKIPPLPNVRFDRPFIDTLQQMLPSLINLVYSFVENHPPPPVFNAGPSLTRARRRRSTPDTQAPSSQYH